MSDMAQCFLAGLTQIFTLTTFGLMLLGIAIGFAVGILPGLGGPTAMAFMLPFVVKMTPVEAFAFLLGMASVVNTTGDITSVLFGIPGEPTTAATIVDGHPMAKKGEAGRALGAVLQPPGSAPFSAPSCLPSPSPSYAPSCSPSEAPSSSCSPSSASRSWHPFRAPTSSRASCREGGPFRCHGGPRSWCPVFSGSRSARSSSRDGIGLVPITIGFFAIPEIIDLAVSGSSIAGGRTGKLGGVMEGVRDVFRHIWLVLRCAAIGTFCGVIPGMGGGTPQWLSYAHAVQSSPNQERFGKGAIEGVLGPGASNNSALGEAT